MSSDDIAISIRDLTKTYRIFGHPGDRLKQALTLGFRRYHREFTSLHNVSLDIRRGETIGIVGRNGSGKSTLLQLICGILKPTSGKVTVNGRIAALLELGAGFNPEFTGRENVFFQGALLGMNTQEIAARFNDICDFAGIGSFIEQPVRIYSSGMFVRLAFSVAVHVSPDILVIDEALSVGDEAFQRKCFSRIHEFIDAGGTLVLVSHSTPWILDLCSRSLLIHDGQLICDDTPKHVIDQYHALTLSTHHHLSAYPQQTSVHPESLTSDSHWDPTLTPSSMLAYPSLGATIQSPAIVDDDGKQVNLLRAGARYRLRYCVSFQRDCIGLRFGMLIKTTSGLELGGAVSDSADRRIARATSNTTATVEFDLDCQLTSGTYFLNCGVLGQAQGEEVFLHRIVDALMFKVLADNDDLHTGIVRLCRHIRTDFTGAAA